MCCNFHFHRVAVGINCWGCNDKDTDLKPQKYMLTVLRARHPKARCGIGLAMPFLTAVGGSVPGPFSSFWFPCHVTPYMTFSLCASTPYLSLSKFLLFISPPVIGNQGPPQQPHPISK